MVVLVVFNSSLDRLSAEAERGFKLHDKFLIDCTWHRVEVVVLGLRLVQTVPWVFFEAFYVDSLRWIGHKDL